MKPAMSEAYSAETQTQLDARERRQASWVFAAWCFQREALAMKSYIYIFLPFLIAGYIDLVRLPERWYPGIGQEIIKSLFGFSAFSILAYAVNHASSAVCWEVSYELRDLVRLTGIEPRTIFWCRILSRWWTILLSIIVTLPLAMFAQTLGGVTSDQWVAGACWLALLIFLNAGFAAIASVSTGHTSNSETTAAWATVLLLVFYHLIFWGFCVSVWIVSWLFSGTLFPTPGSLGWRITDVIWSFAPVNGLYRNIWSSTTFSAFDPTFWLHFVTGFLCLHMASTVMRNRFRVTTQGDVDQSHTSTTMVDSKVRPALRPRCSDQPFLWKDVFILGGGDRAQKRWWAISYFTVIGVIGSAIIGNPFVIGIIAIIMMPCLIAIRFDMLLAAEFREQTWASLMLLPVDPRLPLLAKVQAAAWERQAVLLPVGIAALIAFFTDGILVLMLAAIAMVAGILLIQISILSHFNKKLWWAGPIVAVSIIALIALNVGIWISFDRGTSFLMTLTTLMATAFAFLNHIDWRLRLWSDE